MRLALFFLPLVSALALAKPVTSSAVNMEIRGHAVNSDGIYDRLCQNVTYNDLTDTPGFTDAANVEECQKTIYGINSDGGAWQVGFDSSPYQG